MIITAKVVGHAASLLRGFGVVVGLVLATYAADEAKRHYDLPVGDGVKTLRQFSEVSGREILFAAETVRGLRTNPVLGEFTALAALNQMLASTNLYALEDPLTGAFAVRKLTDAKSGHATTEVISESTVTPSSHKPMNRKNPLRVLAGLFAISLGADVPVHAAAASSPPAAATQGTDSISGLVSSAKTGNTLQGAVVEIPSLNRQVLTDNSGRFTLSGLPAGPIEVVVSYTGLKEERKTIVVGPSGQRLLAVELSPADVLTMDQFTVASEREGNALAVTSQRNALNLKNVVAMDAFGNLPNMGVADIAMRLPGVAPEYDAEGIPSRVSVRGLPTSMTSTTVDGDPVFRGNGVRWVSLYGMSASTYEQIELIKGRMPDESANSLGGGLNLKSRSPLSMTEKRRINYNFGARWAPPFFEHGTERRQHPLHPQVNLSYQEAFSINGGERNFGIGAALHYSEHVNAADQETYIYQNAATGPAYLYDYRSVTQNNNRKIKTADVRMEYRPSATSKYYFGGTYNQGNEPFFDRNQIRFYTSQTIAAIGPDGQPTGTGAVLPGFTETKTQVRGVAASNAEITTSHSSFIATSPSVNFGGEHKLDRWDVDYKIAHTSMHINRGIGRSGSEAGGTLLMRTANVGWIIDRSDATAPKFSQTEGPNIYDPAVYGAGATHTIRDEIEQTWALNARINAAYRLDTKHPTSLKTGMAFERRQNNKTSQGNAQWTRTAGAPALPNAPLFVTRFDERQGGRMPILNATITNKQLATPNLWTEDLYYREVQRLSQTKFAIEKIEAAYAMLRTNIDRFGIVGGVRVERTDATGEGNIRRRLATAAEIPDPVARARYDWGVRSKNEGSYTRSFPSVHLTYDITPEFKARASWSTSFGRPDFISMAPNATISDTAQTVTISNPALGPQYAKNIDLSLNYYFRPAGFLSAGYFEKDIRDYILTVDAGIIGSGVNNGYSGDYAGYTLRTSTNAGSAEVKGWEFDYRQQLTFLPGPFRGLELTGNYTILQTQGNFGGTTVTHDTEVAGFVPRTANAGLAYNYGRFGTRVNFSYQSDYLRNFTTDPSGRTYLRLLRTVDLSFSYRWRQDVSFSCDVSNINGARRAAYQYVPGRIREMYVPGQMVSFRVSGSF